MRGQAVFSPGVANRVSVLDGSLNGLLLMAGFAENSALPGQAVLVRAFGPASLFSGLSPGTLYFISATGHVVPLALISAGALCRSAGGALNSTTILLDKGIVFQKGAAMSSPAAIDSNTGALVVDTSANTLLTATAGAAINPFTALYYDDGANKVFPLDGTLANVQKYVGVSDGGTYAMNATVTYAPPGVRLVGLTALTPGDYFASSTGGYLVAFSSVASLAYTRLVFDAQTSTEGVVVDGPIIQHP